MAKRAVRPYRDVVQALLRDLRQEAGLRQIDVAHKLGEHQSFVSKYEAGERKLDVIELRLVCAVLGISLEEFARRLEEYISRYERSRPATGLAPPGR